MSYYAFFKLLTADGKPEGTAEVAFSERSTADKFWTAIQANPTALGASVKKEDLTRPKDSWFTMKNATIDSLFDVPNQKGFEEIGTQFGIIRYQAQKTAAAPEPEGDVTLSSLAEQIAKLSEQVAAGGGGDGGAAAPGKDQGANWQNGPNWKGGHESFMLVDKAYKTCLQKKDEGDDRGFSMIFAQEMMELRRRQRG